jgi:branched-chain amino acid transport system substrate-binding protein
MGLAVAVAVTACGSSGTKANSGSSSNGSAATGTPIKIGALVGAQGLGLQNLDKSVNAAASYFNAKGGIHGHPIEIVTCDDTGTPESETACANKFVSEKVSAAVARYATNETAFLPALEAAGIPFVPNVALTGVGQKSTVVFANSAAALQGLALGAVYGKERGLNSSALILLGTSSASAVLAGVKPFYEKAGVKFTSQLVAPGTADLTAAVTSAIADQPASLSIFASAAVCTAALKAAQTLGYKGQIFSGGTCNSPEVFQQAGSAVEGAITIANGLLNTQSEADQKSYLDAMAKYAPGTNAKQEPLPMLFTQVAETVAVLNTLPATSDFSAASALSAFKGLKDFRYQFDNGIALTCDRTQLKPAPAVCASKIPINQYKNGAFVSLGALDYAAVVNN